jgi:hypothetical protein
MPLPRNVVELVVSQWGVLARHSPCTLAARCFCDALIHVANYACFERRLKVGMETKHVGRKKEKRQEKESMNVAVVMQMFGDGENSERLAAFSGMMRTLVEQLDAAVMSLAADEDEYYEPTLEEASADDRTINQTYSKIIDVLPVNLHGQPACPLVPRLAPLPQKSMHLLLLPWLHRLASCRGAPLLTDMPCSAVLNTPWTPVMKQLFPEPGRADSNGAGTANGAVGRDSRQRSGNHGSGATPIMRHDQCRRLSSS